MRAIYKIGAEGEATDLRFLADGKTLPKNHTAIENCDRLPDIETLHSPEFLVIQEKRRGLGRAEQAASDLLLLAEVDRHTAEKAALDSATTRAGAVTASAALVAKIRGA